MNENRKVILLTVKVVIGVACFWLIGQRLYDSYSPENLGSLKEIFSASNLPLLAASCLLMLVNWGIEVHKWSLITSPIEKISFTKAWQSVWVGVCIGNLTPGRLGEFAGRILFFKPEARAKIAASHFVCGITQLIVTIVAGCTGLIFYSKGLKFGTYIVTLTLEICLLLFLCILLLRVNKVVTWLLNLTRLKKFNFEGLSYSGNLLLKLIGWSVLRYLIFSFQFLLLLKACGVHGDILKLGAAISIMYVLLSTIPMISVIEVAVRAYVAVLLFGMFNTNDWQLTAASTLLWFINIAIPSILGYGFILKNNLTLRTEKNGVV